jgi:purine nucleosidase
MSTNTIPVLFDTDIGSDIDDAVALAYLLKQPACELLGVTTVSGEPHKRAELASAICHAAGRADVPIHVGAEEPLLVPQRQPQASQHKALSAQWKHKAFGSKENTAIEFLRRTIRSRPGEVTLLAVGPLTNIALLFAIDPEIPGLLKQMVLMGGRFFSKLPHGSVTEWNIICDPHAAAKVFKTKLPRLAAVGLDVTTQCRMPADECRRRFSDAGGPLLPTAAMAEVWFRHSSVVTFHDPLAAALIFEEDLCEMEPCQVEIDLVNPHTLGHTYPVHDPDEEPGHEAAFAVDADAFFEHYFDTVSAGNAENVTAGE